MSETTTGFAPELAAARYTYQHVIEDVFGRPHELETPRLLLRRVTPADLDDLYAYTSDPEVVSTLPLLRIETLEQARNFLDEYLMLYRTSQVAPWGVTLKATGEHIGMCGYENWGPRSDRAELGFMLAHQHWRKGYTTEATRAVVAFGFETMRLNRIEAKTQPANIGARRVLEKVGFQCEGRLRENMYWKGAYHDLDMYALLHREYSPDKESP
ncbi:MAG TPA: GNAT family N-acetyltransferase [Oscillatoriaceae cyanobacterium]